MRKAIWQKGLVLVIMLMFSGTFFVPSIAKNTLSTGFEPVNVLVTPDGENIEITYEINDFTEVPVIINGVEYSIIHLGEESNLLLEGSPDIPSICRSIVIPDTAKMKINAISTEFNEYDNVLIAPSKGNLLRTVNPDDVPFEFGDIYNIDAWFPREIANLREPYILRDLRGQVVEIYPIQYNPVKNLMRVYTNIEVEIYQDGTDTVNIINRENLPDKVDPEFRGIYENHFINRDQLDRYDPVSEQGNMLIIVYDSFWDEMVPFVEWKIMKGIPTEMIKVSEIGNAAQIRAYIADYYDNNGLTFVLLVGDAAQVPTYYSTYHASDPTYSYIVGDDHYPDLFVGRFSAENIDQLSTQVERTIDYEKNPNAVGEWYKKGIGVASNQGPGDDGEYDDEHIDNIRDKLLAYTYTQVNQSYDPTGTTTYIVSSINDGRSTVNYCGHGSMTSWGNGGGLNVNNVNALTNDNMLPFVTSVACNTGEFDSGTCFAEVWMRATNNSEPTGSIANFMSSKSQSWDPPMDAQDEFIDLIIETYPYNQMTSFGAAAFNGCMHMNDEYEEGGYAETDAWHVFGDPSVQVRTDTPAEMTIDREEEIENEATYYEVLVSGVKNALCAISRNGELLGYGYTDEDGYAIINFEEPITAGDPLDLVITAYNKLTSIIEIPVNTNDPPLQPSKPNGSQSGKPGEIYEFFTSSFDPEGDLIFYMWDWGDGNISEWIGPFDSSDIVGENYSWLEVGNYSIKVKAKDTNDAESDWSEELIFFVKKSRNVNTPFLRLLENHPQLFQILRLLFQRFGL